MDSPIAFCLAAITLLAVPGPTNTLLALSGATAGFRRSLPLLLGELAGYNVSIVAQRAAIGVLFAGSSKPETLLRVLVALYLVYLSIRLWRTKTVDQQASFGAGRVFVTTLLNPKALIVALVLMPPEPIVPSFHLSMFSALTVGAGTAWIAAGALAKRVSNDRYAFVFSKLAAVALVTFATFIVSSVLR